MRVRPAVLPGGRIEISDVDLTPGDEVEVIILSQERRPTRRRHLADIIAEAPGGQLFRTAEEVDAYLKEERGSWDR